MWVTKEWLIPPVSAVIKDPTTDIPFSRFKEIRFAEQRKELGIHECRACHSEHSGTRMSILPSNYCRSCHENTEIKTTRWILSIRIYSEMEKWNTCLQCHDFHGNHIYEVPQKMKDTIPLLEVQNYLKEKKLFILLENTIKH